MELVDVRDLTLLHLPFEDAHRCSIGFRSGDMLGQSITFNLSFYSKAVIVLEVCLGSLSCWNTALRPSLQREGIMLCFSMSQYMLAFMVPSMKLPIASSTHAAPDHETPTTMLDCRQDTLIFVLLTWLRHTPLLPSEPNKFILVSSDHRIWFQ